MKIDRTPDRVRIRYFAPLATGAVAVRAGLLVLFLVALPAGLMLAGIDFPFPSPVLLVLFLVGISGAMGVEPHRVEADRAKGVVWDVPSRRGEETVPPAASFHLISDERGVGTDDRPLIWWSVRAGAPDGPVVAEKCDAEIEMGEVASELARFFGVPCVRRVTDGRDVRIEPSDLDMPFVDRVRKYPQTLGSFLPPSESIEIEDEGGEVAYRWGALTAGTALFLVVLWLLSWFYLTWPAQEPTAGERELVWQRAARLHEWGPFYVTALPAAIATLVLLLWRGCVRLTKEAVVVEVSFLLPIRRRWIALHDLREVWASGGSLLLLARDGRARARFFDWGQARSARFVASDIRYRLASRGK